MAPWVYLKWKNLQRGVLRLRKRWLKQRVWGHLRWSVAAIRSRRSTSLALLIRFHSYRRGEEPCWNTWKGKPCPASLRSQRVEERGQASITKFSYVTAVHGLWFVDILITEYVGVLKGR